MVEIKSIHSQLYAKKNVHVFALTKIIFIFSFKSYEDKYYDDIINQSKNWEIKVIRTEDQDPSNIGTTVKEEFQDINPKIILVKNGMFAGLIDYVNCGEYCEVSYVLLEEYNEELILFKTTTGFGSSDYDMMYTVNFYLQKKD